MMLNVFVMMSNANSFSKLQQLGLCAIVRVCFQ